LERNWLGLFRELTQSGNGTVYQLNPLAVRRYQEKELHRTVTDRASAVGIAQYLRHGRRRADGPHAPELPGALTLYRTTRNFIVRCSEIKNELQSLLPSVHPDLVRFCRDGLPTWVLLLLAKYPTAAALGRARSQTVSRIPYLPADRAAALVAAAKESVASLVDEESAYTVRLLAEEVVRLERRVTELKKYLVQQLTHDVEVQRYQSIPGIGPWTATCLRLEYGSLARFHSEAAVVAYAGLDPKTHQSGDTEQDHGISRKGRRGIRAVLFMAVKTAIRCNPVIRAYYERLVAQGKQPLVAMTACMAKMLRIAYACIMTEKPFDAARYREIQERYTAAESAGTAPGQASNGAPASAAGGSLEAPISRKEAKRRRAATLPQAGVTPRERGPGAAPPRHDRRTHASSQTDPTQSSNSR
jgi:transposase